MKEEEKWLVEAILAVAEECKSIDKTLTVWSWRASYKWVSDKDVKLIVGESMRKNWLIMLPIKIEEIGFDKSEREEENQYWKKLKRSYITRVRTTYLLKHTSGDSIEIQGYWHGVDSQDKGAWKATTYAMKYAMLYTFLVATWKMDDADNTHSNDINKEEWKKKEPGKEPKREPVLFTEDRFNKLKKWAKWKEKNEVMQEALKAKKGYIMTKDLSAKIDLFLNWL